MGFEQALSGLTGAAQDLNVIGNNVANASTVGFKESRAQFADLYAAAQGGSGANQIGIGTQMAAIAPQFTQGNIQTTGNPLDVAINGNGFFREDTNGAISFSRDGQFSLDANGFIVNSLGGKVTGYPATAQGTISNAPPVPIQLSQAPVAPAATQNVAISVNLNATATPIPAATAFSVANSGSYNSSTSVTVYDSLGTAHTLSLYFRNTGTNTWDVYASGDGTQVGAGAVSTLTFGTSGTLSASNPALPVNVNIPVVGAQNPLTFAVNLPTASTTQYGVPFAVSSNTQDGYTTGQLAGYSIAKDGTISGRYSNGQTRAMGQIALAMFANPQGLVAEGGNQWTESAASGPPVVGAPGAGTMGVVQSGALEESTVDLTAELVNMITAQRVYQANAETVKTQDQVQQTLMNLR